MRKLVVTGAVILIVILLIGILGPFYIINEGEQAVVIRFGEVVAAPATAGLKLKTPLVDNVVKFSQKILSWDGDATELPTLEKQYIWIDTTARWQIEDVRVFYTRMQTMESAFDKIDQVVEDAVRTVIADNYLREAVRSTDLINNLAPTDTLTLQQSDQTDQQAIEELSELTQSKSTYEQIEQGRQVLSQKMFQASEGPLKDYGIKLIDIVIKQVRYSETLTNSVYERMIKERNQQAQAYRSYGQGNKAELLGKLENDRVTILSEAYEKSESIKGEADAKAANIYAEAYTADPEFFEFWRSIESYRKVLPNFRKTLTTDMDYFRFMYDEFGG